MQEKKYSLFITEENKILAILEKHEGSPKDPQVIYANGDNALLYRSKDEIIVLDYLHPALKEYFKKDNQITIYEKGGLYYTCPLKRVEILPDIPMDSFPSDLSKQINELRKKQQLLLPRLFQQEAFCSKLDSEGTPVFIFEMFQDAPSQPEIFFNKETALFARSPASYIILNELEPSMQKALLSKKEAHIIELNLNTQEIVRSYSVIVHK